jgi:flagellar biosynthetic protein FlhB
MADDNDDDKTEEPTEKRLADAVERGNTPVSREIGFLVSMAAYLLIEIYVLPATTPHLSAALAHFLDDPSGWRLESGGDASALAGALAAVIARFLGPPALLLMAFGVGGSIAQNAPRIVATRIVPDFKRLSPLAGLSRLFGPRGWTEFAKSALKLGVVGVAVGFVLASQRLALVDAIFVDAAPLPGRLLSLCLGVTAAIGVAVLALAGADFAWTRIHWRRDQRMSRYEVKEEIKQAEGDRMLKARLRSLRLDRSRRNMMKNAAKATMVVVNPTHYAVALRYVRSEGGAPTVLAKGVDLIALKIRAIAAEHDIPIIEDKPLARSLYDAVAVDATIPQEFYRAVAEIVHFIQSKRASGFNRRRLN